MESKGNLLVVIPCPGLCHMWSAALCSYEVVEKAVFIIGKRSKKIHEMQIQKLRVSLPY